MARGKRHTPESFWALTKRVGECLEWQGARLKWGHGRVSYQGRWVATHRLAWELSRGPLPKGVHVCHTCDNPPCVNPLHLFLGTVQSNQMDRTAKGRNWLSAQPGERHPRARLTLEDVANIRRLYASGGWNPRTLGDRFGVSYQHVWKIVQGERWRD